MSPYSVTLWDLFLSTLRWSVGLSAGALVGVALAVLHRFLRAYFLPFSASLNFLRALPILGLLPLMQYCFGPAETGKFLLIAIAAVFPVYFAVRDRLLQVPLDQKLFLDALALPLERRWSLDIGPRIVAGVLQGVEISIGLAWITVVAAESIGTFNQGFWAGGIGHKLFSAFDANRVSDGIVALAIFGVVGLASAYAWRLLQRWWSA